MLFQPEDLAAVNPDPLEHSIAIQEAMIVHGHHGRASVAPFAVDPDGRRADALGRRTRLGLGSSCHDVECKAASSREPWAADPPLYCTVPVRRYTWQFISVGVRTLSIPTAACCH